MSNKVKLAAWAETIELSAMQKLLAQSSSKEMLAFSLGLPANEFFPLSAFGQAMTKVMHHGALSFQYSLPAAALKEQIVLLMKQRNIHCNTNQIFLTAGAQQGLSMLARLLMDFKSEIITEDLAYPGLLQAVAPLQPRILTVSTSLENGIEVDEIEHLIKKEKKPAFIYTIADGHNPLAVTMSLEKRKALVEIGKKYKIPIIEDDAYGLLNYEDSLPAIRSFDDQWVFYVGSFSKIIAPSLRVGWLVIPEELSTKLSILKESSDINTATLSQHILSHMLNDDFLTSHLSMLRYEYRLRRDAMIQSLSEYFPQDTICYKTPKSGIFIWIEFLANINTTELLKHVMKTQKITFIPGASFAVYDPHKVMHCIRLNFSSNNCTLIKDGMKRFADSYIEWSQLSSLDCSAIIKQ